jgi:hypothetical protein
MMGRKATRSSSHYPSWNKLARRNRLSDRLQSSSIAGPGVPKGNVWAFDLFGPTDQRLFRLKVSGAIQIIFVDCNI